MSAESYNIDSLQATRQNFYEHLQGNIAKGTNLPFFFNTLPQRTESLKADRRAHIFVIGGTRYASSQIDLNNSAASRFEGAEFGDISPLDKMSDLVGFVNAHIHPETTDIIGINLAIALFAEIRDDYLDGRINKGTKHRLEGLDGRLVGETLESELEKLHKRQIKVSVANDAVCLSLAAQDEHPEVGVAGVVGTGFNLALIGDERIINLQAGEFGGFEFTDSLKFIDENSPNPGRFPLEKMVAGKYLYQHYNFLKGTQELPDSEELSLRAQQGDELAQSVIARSAQLVATSLAGIMDYYDAHELTAAFEGSVFWNCHQYREHVIENLLLLGFDPGVIKFVNIENSSLKGALSLIS